jgi:hypothetical protein
VNAKLKYLHSHCSFTVYKKYFNNICFLKVYGSVATRKFMMIFEMTVVLPLTHNIGIASSAVLFIYIFMGIDHLVQKLEEGTDSMVII